MPDRIVRAGILTSDPVNDLSWPAEVFYRRLFSVVDDFGRYDGRGALLRSHLYPLKIDKVSEADVGKWLTECVTAGLVSFYRVAGRPYVEVLKFGSRVRAEKSKWPSSADADKHPQESADTCQQPHANAAVFVGVVGDVVVGDSSVGLAVAKPPAAKPKVKKKQDTEAPTTGVWNAYSLAYERRYGTEPLRNGKVNGILSKFLTLVPIGDAPDIAAFFVSHNQGLYVSAKHVVELLVRDAERLHSDWRTNSNAGVQGASYKERDTANAIARVHEITGGLAAAKPALVTRRNDALQQVFDATDATLKLG